MTILLIRKRWALLPARRTAADASRYSPSPSRRAIAASKIPRA